MPSSTVSIGYSLWLKRAFDIAASAAALVLLLPMFVVVAIAIKRDSPGPVFFRQERIGQGGRPFRIIKFRSMGVGASRQGGALTKDADKRITRVGAFLRRNKIDELPQLMNVFWGSMSLVGPRPEVPQLISYYAPQHREILFFMRPGMTDFSSILLHDVSSLYDQDSDPVEVYRRWILPIKFELCQRYCDQITALNDLRIILATIMLIVLGRVPERLGIEHELKIPSLQRRSTGKPGRWIVSKPVSRTPHGLGASPRAVRYTEGASERA